LQLCLQKAGGGTGLVSSCFSPVADAFPPPQYSCLIRDDVLKSGIPSFLLSIPLLLFRTPPWSPQEVHCPWTSLWGPRTLLEPSPVDCSPLVLFPLSPDRPFSQKWENVWLQAAAIPFSISEDPHRRSRQLFFLLLGIILLPYKISGSWASPSRLEDASSFFQLLIFFIGPRVAVFVRAEEGESHLPASYPAHCPRRKWGEWSLSLEFSPDLSELFLRVLIANVFRHPRRCCPSQ